VSYRELLEQTDAPPGSAWAVFGAGDQLGMLNNLSNEATVAAASLVRTGEVFTLDYPINTFVPSLSGTRPAAEHHIFANNPNHRDDWLDAFYLQSTTQIDGLRHIRHPEHGFYGGVPDADIVEGSPALGIQHAAERGVVGRGVLLDVARYRTAIGRPYDVSSNVAFTAADLDEVMAFEGIESRPGDIVLLRFGWAEAYLSWSAEERAERRAKPGLLQAPETLEWLWNRQVALVAADNGGVEAWPVHNLAGWVDPDEDVPTRGPNHSGMLHRPAIALLGLMLGELWRLDALARACAADGVYEFFLTAKPLNLVGGVGSPANAMAIK
jgi:kynurenine formamidase